MKKCPICYSILPPKVIFCPVCGTELQPQISENTEPVTSTPYQQHNNPAPRQVFRDEPVETIVGLRDDFDEGVQYAWKVSDSMLPIQLKGETTYSEGFNAPKFKLGILKNLGVFNVLQIGSLSFVVSILLVIQIGLIGVLAFIPTTSLLTVISVLAISIVLSSLGYFMLNQRTGVILTKKKETKIEKPKKNFLVFLVTHGLHLVILGLVTATCLKSLQILTHNANFNVAIYSSAIILVILMSFITPPFRISKLFTNVRESSILQNFHDAYHFPKISIRRSLELILFSIVLPAIFIIMGLNSMFKILSRIFDPAVQVYVSSWDYFICVLIILLLKYSFLSMMSILSLTMNN
ncbi:MAG: hypothetical protein ACXABK_02595 [Candidatus Heimdallarchaeaceae archaeon]